MRRLNKFRQEFSGSLTKTKSLFGGLVWLLGFGMTISAAIGAYSNWLGTVPGAVLLAIPPAIYIAFLAGRAWANSHGPFIELGDLTLDERNETFFVDVRNPHDSHESITPNIMVTNVVDHLGNEFPSVRGSVSTHWRDESGAEIVLRPNETKQAGILLIGRAGDRTRLSLFHKADQVRILTDYLADRERQPISIEITANFSTNSGVEGKPEIRKFNLIPRSEHGWQVVRSSPDS